MRSRPIFLVFSVLTSRACQVILQWNMITRSGFDRRSSSAVNSPSATMVRLILTDFDEWRVICDFLSTQALSIRANRWSSTSGFTRPISRVELGEAVSMETRLSLLAIGDCNTEGCEVLPEQSSLPTQLAKLLIQRGYAVDVQNWGRTMSTSREGFHRLRREPVIADIALINFGLVDSWVTTIPKFYIPYYPDSLMRKWGRKLLKMAKRRLRKPWLSRIVPCGEVVPLAEFRDNVERMIERLRAVNPATKVVLWGSVPVLHDRDRNLRLTDYNRSLRELAEKHNASYLDVDDIVASLPTEAAYIDAVHLNAPALALIAEAMVECLGSWDTDQHNLFRMVA